MLRAYQSKLKEDIYDSWRAGNRNTLAVLPTGGGKTVVVASIFQEVQAPRLAIAHRQELVSQISLTFARTGIHHRIVAPKSIVAFCITQHIKHYGRSFHHPQAEAAVAGVDTLVARNEKLTQWLNQLRYWVIDEAHHVLRDNKWGKAAGFLPNAYGLGVTATPCRCDRKSLGRAKSGVFDAMVEGPTTRQLIDMGHLCDYRFIAPPASYTMDASDIGASGEFSQDKARQKSHKSRITGDIVDNYLKFAPGKRGITFVVDVETAAEVAAAFRDRGVPAESVSAKTPDNIRTAFVEKFRAGQILNLVNVDLFGEGFDVPAVEVVSGGQPTMSFGRFSQAFGRMLRPFEGKERGIYIDHVENWKIHGLPDKPRIWSLDDERGKRRAKDDAEALTRCTAENCYETYSAALKACPHCGHAPEPMGRSAPEMVDGDLTEFSPELLAQLRGEIARADAGPTYPLGATPVIKASLDKHFRAKMEAQRDLRECVALWAGVGREVYGRSDSEQYRRFYLKYGLSVPEAFQLNAADAVKLTNMIRSEMI